LQHAGHDGKTYPLSGPQTLTKPEQVAPISTGIGHTLDFEEISPDEWHTADNDALSAFVRKFLLEIRSRSTVTPEQVLSTVTDVTGRPARSLAEWAADHTAQFGGESR
jgi:hypothetical protein